MQNSSRPEGQPHCPVGGKICREVPNLGDACPQTLPRGRRKGQTVRWRGDRPNRTVDPLDPFSKPLRMPTAHVTVVTADLASAF